MFKSALSQIGYIENFDTGVWSRSDFEGIKYSDGDEIEQRIAANVAQVSDLSVLSLELRQHCIDWPSRYHLGSARANLLRPFADMLHDADVLEIGAGCGAITRYLGEQGANVLALEGSPRRAAIARSRTRDLENVIVVADQLATFSKVKKYDVVTLIGVLEYSSVFSNADDPALIVLREARSLLKPDGILIVAIENQLGLKYFAGAPEDHIGRPMYGLEGRYRKGEPQTWGRKALRKLLLGADFETIEFCAPYPDYKLPMSIVSEFGFAQDGFDAGVFAWQNTKRDLQYNVELTLSPELVSPVLVENGLALDMANSFLVVASPSSNAGLNKSVLAWHYSTDRKKAFCKETRFIRAKTGEVEVKCTSLADDNPSKKAKGELIEYSIVASAPYIWGRPLSKDFIELVAQDGWSIEDLGLLLKRYLHILSAAAGSRGQEINIKTIHDMIPGEYFDCIPQNIIIRPDGSCELIDQEWTLIRGTSVGELLFRALLLLIISVTRFGRFASEVTPTPFGFMQAAFQGASLVVSEATLRSYAENMIRVQADVAGGAADSTAFIEWLSSAPLPGCTMGRERGALLDKPGEELFSNANVKVLKEHPDLERMRIMFRKMWPKGQKAQDNFAEPIWGSPKNLARLSDAEWLSMLRKSAKSNVVDGITLPGFPEDNIQIESVGSAGETTIGEAFNFYSFIKDQAEKIGQPIRPETKILDFGAGWGRTIRCFLRDADPSNLHGVDVSEKYLTAARKTGIGNLRAISPTGSLPYPDQSFDIVYAYSVFTHLPKHVQDIWLPEIARVLRPGGLFVPTVEPRRFYDFVKGLNEETKAKHVWYRMLSDALAKVPDAGEQLEKEGFLFLPTNGIDTYGDTVMTPEYIEANWTESFRILGYLDDSERFFQAVVSAQKTDALGDKIHLT